MSINKATPQDWNKAVSAAASKPPDWEKAKQPKKAKKFDQDKPAVDLICPEYILGTAEVLTFGAKKYGRKNYLESVGDADYYGRLYSAVQRHLLAYHAGEELDPESGIPHLFHASAGLAMLIEMGVHE